MNHKNLHATARFRGIPHTRRGLYKRDLLRSLSPEDLKFSLTCHLANTLGRSMGDRYESGRRSGEYQPCLASCRVVVVQSARRRAISSSSNIFSCIQEDTIDALEDMVDIRGEGRRRRKLLDVQEDLKASWLPQSSSATSKRLVDG